MKLALFEACCLWLIACGTSWAIGDAAGWPWYAILSAAMALILFPCTVAMFWVILNPPPAPRDRKQFETPWAERRN